MKKGLILTLLLLLPLSCAACGMNGPAETAGPGTAGTDSPVPEDTDRETTLLPETTSPLPSGEDFTVPKDTAELREYVISYFNELANVKWICKDTMDFRETSSITTKLLYERGKTYYGIPYTARRVEKACLIEFLDNLNGKGFYTGPTDYATLVGGDCGSMRTAWAWGGAVYGVGMSYYDYEYFENPNEIRNRVKGFIVPVGDFDYSHYDYTLPFSECVFPYNDLEEMSKSYAELKACDIIGKRWRSGKSILQHLRMIVEDATVVRNGKGEIVPDKSYIVYSEQTSTMREVDGKNTTWQMNVKQSFKTLYNDGYIPMTNTCLKSETVVTPKMTISGENKAENMAGATLFKGSVECNYNIFAAELTVKDESGNTVIHAKTYPYALRFNVSEMPVDKAPSDLPAGKYHYTLKATIGFGTKKLIDMDFTKE